jgi:hypothetical protein
LRKQSALVAVEPVSTARPLKRNEPMVGTSRQPMMFIAVDLPEPDGPMTATKSPSLTSRSMPLSAWKAMAPVP